MKVLIDGHKIEIKEQAWLSFEKKIIASATRLTITMEFSMGAGVSPDEIRDMVIAFRYGTTSLTNSVRAKQVRDFGKGVVFVAIIPPITDKGTLLFSLEITLKGKALQPWKGSLTIAGVAPEVSAQLSSPNVETASIDLPVFLFPCRIETRIVERYLKVRVYPDQLLINKHVPELTKEEWDDGVAYNSQQAETSWDRLCEKYRAPRAAWIAKVTKPKDGVAPALPAVFRNNDQLHFPSLDLLPDFFLLTLYLDNGKEIFRRSKDITGPLSIFEPNEGEGMTGAGGKWVSDFDEAFKKGMAMTVSLDLPEFSGAKKINRVVVSGIRSEKGRQVTGAAGLQKLFEAQYHSSGIRFIDHGTPTNNTTETNSGYSSIPDAAEYDPTVAVGATQQATSLSSALGIDPAVLSRWANNENPVSAMIESWHKALWPVTGRYFLRTFLKDLLGPETEEKTRIQFEKFVRPLGSLPSIQVGRLPYGILPVTQIRKIAASGQKGWQASARDFATPAADGTQWSAFDNQLLGILEKFTTLWLDAANSKEVPKAMDASGEFTSDEEITRILSSSPEQVDYIRRSFFEDKITPFFLMFLRQERWLSSPDGDVSAAFNQARADDGNAFYKFFKDKLGIARPVVEFLLGKILTLGSWRMKPYPLVRQTNSPYVDIAKLLENSPSEDDADTLLYKLLWRSKDLKPIQALDKSRAALKFLNSIQDEKDVIKRQRVSVDKLSPSAIQAIKDIIRKRKADRKDFQNLDEIKALFPGDALKIYTELMSVIFDSLEPRIDPESIFKSVLDSLSYRLDPWISSLANKRLDAMRKLNKSGILLGAYGFVENLPLQPDKPSSGGFTHAPSVSHAIMAAILKNAFNHDPAVGENSSRLNDSSDRIRRALEILEGMRNGQDLAALLGYQFERHLHDGQKNKFKAAFRNGFPFDFPSSQNVVNGLKLIEEPMPPALQDIINNEPVVKAAFTSLRDLADAIGDLSIKESVFQVVNGNYERGGGVLDLASGSGTAIEPQSVSVPLARKDIGNSICIIFNASGIIAGVLKTPREKAEPVVARWFKRLLGDQNTIGCCVKYQRKVDSKDFTAVVLLKDLNISAIDFLYMSAHRPGDGVSEIEARIRQVIRDRDDELDEDPSKGLTIEINTGRFDNNPYKPQGPSYSRSIDDAVEFANKVLQTLGHFPYLKPATLYKGPQDVNSQNVVSTDFSPAHMLELKARVTTANDEFKALIDDIARQIPIDLVAAAQKLFELTNYGLEFSLKPLMHSADVEVIRQQAAKRYDAALALLGQVPAVVPPGENGKMIDILVSAMKEIFGRGFIVLPLLTMPDGAAAGRALSDQRRVMNVLKEKPLRPSRIQLWMQQVAQTHKQVARFEDMMLFVNAWNETVAPKPYVVPQPVFAADPVPRWQALSNAELGVSSVEERFTRLREDGQYVPMRSTHGLCIYTDIDFTQAEEGAVPKSNVSALDTLVGFIVDEWTEALPFGKVDTAVTFEADSPNQQAPNCCLLAVPGQRDQSQWWNLLDLDAIVYDSLDLAKIRSVDTESMPDMLGILPAVFMPVDKQQDNVQPIKIPFELEQLKI